MKITEVQKVTRTFHYVETDERDWPEYRRWGPDNWEQRMGESWEGCYDEKIEKQFQEWMNSGI